MNGFISHQTLSRAILFGGCLSIGFLAGFQFENKAAISFQHHLKNEQLIFAMNDLLFQNDSNVESALTNADNQITLREIMNPELKPIRQSFLVIRNEKEELENELLKLQVIESGQDNIELVESMKDKFVDSVLIEKSSAEVVLSSNVDYKTAPLVNGLSDLSKLTADAIKLIEKTAMNTQNLSTQAKKSLDIQIKDTVKTSSVSMNRSSFSYGDCSLIPRIKLLKPVENLSVEESQVCPFQKEWLSKNWKEEGWIRLEVESYFPVVAYYPQSNSNVVLMDQNSVALMSIKSGIHYSKEHGMIMGTVPAEYKVDLSGKSEDIQYFQLNGINYFFVLNVDPGANVIELYPEKNPNDITTVFAPVIQETVTYLDLKVPEKKDIKISINKVGIKNREDLNELAVSLSAQTITQSKTDKSGFAILKNVSYVSEYPIFLDVSSKLNGNKSYQYRYQLALKNDSEIHTLLQFKETEIQKWVKQMKIKLNDQSSLVIGKYDRKMIDGFKNHRYAKTNPVLLKTQLKTNTYSITWDGQLGELDPLEGDQPRFISALSDEGIYQSKILDESKELIHSSLIPASPRIISVISE